LFNIVCLIVFAMGQPSLSNRQALASVTGRRVSGGCALRISETRAGRRKAALVLSSVLSFLALAGAFLPLRAQTMASPSQREGSASLRAVNMARMTAERLNGGLQVYRAAACMHQQSGGSCLIRSSSDGYLFRFYGGEPGWQQLGKNPTFETEILVSPDGRSIQNVIYNGPIRSSGNS
jgi:hypothetical protein